MKMRQMGAAVAALVAAATAQAAVNVLTLGAKNDGSEDVSAIVNKATQTDALYFPAGQYKVSKPIWLKHAISGESYTRIQKIDPTRTWFVSDLDCAKSGASAILNLAGPGTVNIERIAMMCKGFEDAISITGCVQTTCTWINQVGAYNLRGTGIRIRGWGSRPIYVQDFTVFGARDWPEGSTGILIDGVCDCRLSNIEIMGTQIGLVVNNGHTFGDNLHLWTGCMGGRDNGKWWKGTRGLVLGPRAHFSASQVYPDTSYYAVEQRGSGGSCEIANIMYWEDGSIKVSPEKTGAFYHREPTSTAKFIVHGGLVGMSGSWMARLYAPEAEIRGVIVLCDAPLEPKNLDRLCFGRELPDYSERYAERGWCKAADVLAAAPTGSCEARLMLDDGAAWKVTCVKTDAAKPAETAFEPLNALCKAHAVKAVERNGATKILVRHDDAAPMTVRFTTVCMGDRFRPLDHGTLRTVGSRTSRCHEVLP